MAGTGYEQYLKGAQQLADNNDAVQAKTQLSQTAFEQTGSNSPPHSDWQRREIWLGDGIKNFIPGIGHALQRDFTTWDGLKGTAEMIGSSALLGAVLKTALPEGGIAGKLAGLAIGTYFTVKAAEPIKQSYDNAMHAKTMTQLHNAGAQFGDALGDFGVNTVISAGGYKLGSGLAGRALSSEAMDGFAVRKAQFWQPTENFMATHLPDWASSRLITPEAIQRARTIDLNTVKWDVKGNRATLLDSMRESPKGEAVGPIDPKAQFDVSVYAKSLDPTGIKLDRRLARIAQGKADFVTDEEMAAKFGADPVSVQAIHQWAQSHGLEVRLTDGRTGRIVVRGTGEQMENALGTKLQQWQTPDGQIHRGRVGALQVDAAVAPHIDSILGADNRPQMRAKHTGFVPFADETQTPAQSRIIRDGAVGPDGSEAAQPNALGPKPIMANDLARARGVPAEATGRGKVIGIGELGGDLDISDNAQFYTKRGLHQPEIVKKGVNGYEPTSDGPNGADGEVALDTIVAGLAAPEAKQVIAWGENSDAGFADTHNELAFPTDGNSPHVRLSDSMRSDMLARRQGIAPEAAAHGTPAADVISWSWGQGEYGWTRQALRTWSMAAKRSAAKGITTFVASGDDGAVDRNPSGKATVDYPSADPEVSGVGGTQVTLGPDGKIAREIAWNDGPNGGQTGGGRSEKIARPEFQRGLNMPDNINGTNFDGRGVPDVAENASPRSGYIVRVDGHEGAIGGTSGAAPQWAAYTADASQLVGRNFGNMNYFFYKNGNSGIFSDITQGNNNGYPSGPGWDANTGWGPPVFPKLVDALRNDTAGSNKIRDLFPVIVNQPGSDNSRTGSGG
jgi:kumamolisin